MKCCLCGITLKSEYLAVEVEGKIYCLYDGQPLKIKQLEKQLNECVTERSKVPDF